MSLHIAFDAYTALRERCEVAALRTTEDEPHYEEGAVVPAGEWQPLDPDLAERLRPTDATTDAVLVELVRLPPAEPDELARMSTGTFWPDRLTGRPSAEYLGFVVSEPQALTTTGNSATGRRIGLTSTTGTACRQPPPLPAPPVLQLRPRRPLSAAGRPGRASDRPHASPAAWDPVSPHRRRAPVRCPAENAAMPPHSPGPGRWLRSAHRTPAPRWFYGRPARAVHGGVLAGAMAARGHRFGEVEAACLELLERPRHTVFVFPRVVRAVLGRYHRPQTRGRPAESISADRS